MSFVAVKDIDCAGALVFWSLSGEVVREELMEYLELAGFGKEWYPEIPSKKVVAIRAAERACTGVRQFVRPLQKRSAWVIVTERVVSAPQEHDRIELQHNVRLTVPLTAETTDEIRIDAVTEDDAELARNVADFCEHYDQTLVPTDISSWLLRMLGREFTATSLRDRGGFYFIPNEHLETWRRLSKAVRQCSAHKLYEIPAMRTEEAVAAILDALRRDVQMTFQDFEEYLAGDVSTRGLNSWERELAIVVAKTQKYAQLLGVALPDLVQKSETLQGSLQAARLLNEQS